MNESEMDKLSPAEHASKVCYAIEELPASIEQTNMIRLASRLQYRLQNTSSVSLEEIQCKAISKVMRWYVEPLPPWDEKELKSLIVKACGAAYKLGQSESRMATPIEISFDKGEGYSPSQSETAKSLGISEGD